MQEAAKGKTGTAKERRLRAAAAEEAANAELRREIGVKARAAVKKTRSVGRKKRKTTPREPISVTVAEALTLIPIGKTQLYEALRDGKIKSRLVLGVRSISYKSLKETFGEA